MAKAPELMTTVGGNPIADNQNPITVCPHGLLSMQDHQSLEKLAHQNRERIPERAVRAKRSTSCGTLTITRDIMQKPRPGAVKSKYLAVSS